MSDLPCRCGLRMVDDCDCESPVMLHTTRKMLDKCYEESDRWREAVELAYGLLWSDVGTVSRLKRRAQKVLLAALREGHDGHVCPGQRAGIEAARELMEREDIWVDHERELIRMDLDGRFDKPK